MSDRPPRRLLALMLAGVAAFGLAAGAWMRAPTLPALDAWGYALAQHSDRLGLRTMLQTITWIGSPPVAGGVALLLGGWCYRRAGGRAAGLWIGAVAAGEALVYALKSGFSRHRPTAPGLLRADFSFPSGHAFTAVLVYGAVVWALWPHAGRRTRPLLAIGGAFLVLAIGASRVLLGVHYVTDVLGGFALGLAWLAATVGVLHVPDRQVS